MTSVKTRLPSRKVLPYSDQLIYEANVVNCNCFYSSIKPTQIDNIWYAHFWTTPHRAKNKRFLTLRCTKTGSTQPKLSAACFVVQSCLADADFVVFSNYCLIGTRPKGCLFLRPPAQRGFYRSAAALHRCSPHRVGASQRGHSLSQKRMAPLEPQEKGLDWQSRAWMTFVPPECDFLRAALPRWVLLDDLPLLLLSAAALPIL